MADEAAGPAGAEAQECCGLGGAITMKDALASAMEALPELVVPSPTWDGVAPGWRGCSSRPALGLADDWSSRHLTADLTALFRVFRTCRVTAAGGGSATAPGWDGVYGDHLTAKVAEVCSALAAELP